MSRAILVLNAGSTSIKFVVFDLDLVRLFDGQADGIGGAARLVIDGEASSVDLSDHRRALAALLDALAARDLPPEALAAAGHRVVHGGEKLTAPARITPGIRAAIEAAFPLAPLHNPLNLSAIDRLAELAPDLPQCASFDTGFHAAAPELSRRYAVPQEIEAMGIRRYGFHGLSYAGLVASLPDLSGAPLPRRLLAFHLGGGASAAAIADGRSVATTMGYSPVSGLTMGTRTGEIDANAVLRLAEEFGVERAGQVLNKESGLLGLSGSSAEMRALLEDGSEAARFAVAHFCYWARREAGSLVAAMGGLDAIAFTGGIGEKSARVRAEIVKGLGWLGAALDEGANAAHGPAIHRPGSLPVWVVPADEERQIAADTKAVLEL
ncbi:MAG: acetate kinase [Pseudomonadota bacterium]